MATFWFCEVCKTGGTIEHNPHIDAWSGIQAVYQAHQQASPDCSEFHRIRVSLIEP